MRKKLVLLVALVFVVILGYVVVSALEAHAKVSAARKVSDTFVTDVLAGNNTASYALLVDKTKKSTPESTWQGTVQNMRTSFAGDQPSYQATENQPTYTAFTYTITSGGAKYQFRVVTRLQNKTWLVESFVSNLQS